MDKQEFTNQGEQLTFHKLLNDKKFSIEIPIIQRDYAQGRYSANDVSDHFLNTLYKHLKEKSAIDLDFIYGSIIPNSNYNRFVPLDGQQRLTTLFLLHWYLATKENKLALFHAFMKTSSLSRFSYETRISSREFCNALVINEIDIPPAKDELVSEIIKDAHWFFLSWERDPTIASMLVMIDKIHRRFWDIECFDNLIDSENPLITFQFIELRSFGLSDSLYIKMNARGKPLTDFENLKAKFEQLLDVHDKTTKSSKRTYFSHKIDSEWTDLFWNYKDERTNVFDDQIMNFFRVIATNYYALRGDDKNLSTHLKLLIGKDNPEAIGESVKKIDFYKFEDLGCFTPEGIDDIIGGLDAFKNGISKAKEYLPNKSILDERTLFDKVVSNSLVYTERIQFYALYKFLIIHKSTAGLFEWMRIIRNLSENSIYNEAIEFAASIRSISDLIPFAQDIEAFVANSQNVVKGFAAIQVEEERIKAVLVRKSDEWREAIIGCENHKYFKGQIGFILKFTGITDRYAYDKNLQWSEEDNKTLFTLFLNYIDKSDYFFWDKGLRKFDDFIVERAILCYGDYLLTKGRNHSFLIDSFDRDISWKRLLRSSDRDRRDEDDKKRNYLKQVFDAVNIDSVENDLQNIIDTCSSDDWRKHFIKHPGLISVCGSNKFIRFEHATNILLLEKSQTNGIHREYYSYALCLKLRELGNTVYYMDSNSVDNYKYIYSINGKSIKIKFDYFQNARKYKVEYGADEKFFDAESDVIQYLVSHSLLATNAIAN